jgi:hypothetical protein
VLQEIIQATEKKNPTISTRNVLSFLGNFMVDFRNCSFLEINSRLSAAISTQNDKMCDKQSERECWKAARQKRNCSIRGVV